MQAIPTFLHDSKRDAFTSAVIELMNERLVNGHLRRKINYHLRAGNTYYTFKNAKKAGINEDTLHAILTLLIG